MASWAALNVTGGDTRANLAQERATEEAQDADNAATYEQALRYQQQKQTTQAKALYQQLLSGQVRVSPRLEYLCNKNLATMELEAKSFEHALEFFAAALALDATDVVVWFQMATTAVETGKLWLARRTLEEGLKVDATYWPLVETLAQVLSEIGDVDEYRRVAEYLRRNDPHCATVKLLDGDERKRARPTSRDVKLLRRAQKRVQHLKNIADEGFKRRKVLQQEMNEELRTRMQTRSYEVQQPSWSALGKVLLEAFEENNRDEYAHMMRTKVEIKVGYDEQENDKEVEVEKELRVSKRETDDKEKSDADKQPSQDESDHPPPAKRPKHKEVAKISAAVDTPTGISDNDTQDSPCVKVRPELGGILSSEMMEFQPRRRKSRRNEERLREEHAAAVKKAREKDLAYRLGAFLPDFIDKEDRESTPESVSIEWLPPLNVEFINDEFHISNASKKILSKASSFIFTSTSEGSANTTELQSSQVSSREHATQAARPRVECVTGKQIATFISESEAGTESSCGVIDWVCYFLNQCGEWYHLKLGNDNEDIHRVCSWLEKALNGELDVAKAATPTQSSIINVSDRSLIQGSRFEGNRLTLGARLFLLELHFDMLLQQPVRGKRRRKVRRLVETQLAQAQKLLFEFGWLEDSEESLIPPTGCEFLRLLWIIARMYERCGNPQVAQDYYIRCREKLVALNEDDGSKVDHNADSTFRVDLPNQKTDSEITLEILDEKISGLRFSDVCSEAQRLFETEDHDRVISTLLGHFFPIKQAPRMTDFLNEFGVDDDDLPARGDGNKKLFEMVLESFSNCSKYSAEDTVMFLLTTLYYVIEFLDGLAVTTESNMADDSPDEVCANALTSMDFILLQLTKDNCERITHRDHKLLLRGLCVRCLKPSILLRFDTPNDILSMIRVSFEIDKTVDLIGDDDYMAQRMIVVDAMARLLYMIRSLSGDEFQNLFTLVPHPVKRKQPRRDRIRLVLVELIRVLNRAFRDDDKLALSFPLEKRSALMTLCCTLMKEEEENVARSDGKTPKQLVGNGAILFVLLYESYCRPDPDVMPTQLVELIHLLHERLGQHGICGLTYFSEAGSHGISCFLELCTVLLNKFVKQKASVRHEEKSLRKSDQDSVDEGDDEDDEEEAEYRFQREVCQCYRCLYDVQILPGCEDHKTGTTFASLQSAEQSVKHKDALRMTRFAVPILLATKSKNNGQKKERLKLLYAIRDALSDSSFAALSVQPTTISPPLEAYLAPRGLLHGEVVLPFPLDTGGTTTKSADEACLGHLWYLMGANFILGRVKRRGNLVELMEMEQHVRERVEFLMKDVLYYHPDRIDSWVCLGKTMKELYHAATDAFAAVLGQKLRIRAFQWYTTKVLNNYQDVRSIESTQGQRHPDMLSFHNVVLDWNLFKKIKEWQDNDIDGHKTGSKASTSKDTKEVAKENNIQDHVPQSHVPIEEFATVYIAQVIEFARRCFEMAARLAEEAAKKHELKIHENAATDADGERNFDEELDDLQNKIIECNEESGLLLYNVLQEFSLMKDVNFALFPRDVYSRLTEKALAYFRRGLKVCESNEDAHEDHFRLQYMIGKTLKKRRWLELRQQTISDPEALSTATEMAECFTKAEAAREEGDREHALVHAFYALQALRIDLTISESPSISALHLVCDHFYEEEENVDEEENDDQSTGSTPSATEADEMDSQEDKTATSKDTAKNTSSKTTDPSDIKSATTSKKDSILALLSNAESDETSRELNVTLGRGWLALNIIEALESIPDEDRYFHPSRYVLARIVYWLSTCYTALEQSGLKGDNVTALLDAVRARRNEEKVEGPSDAAARALKEMAPIFDKRRPQIVAIWFSEYIPTAKKFEELNQRQMKYDYYRLKYWRFYIALLQENAAYARLKEVGSWVLACKEDHDVIDIMLGIVLHARGKVLRSRLLEFLNSLERVTIERPATDAVNVMSQAPGEERSVDSLLKQLAKTYTYYLEVLNAQQRLAHVMDDCGLLLENAELPLVAVFFIGAIKYQSEIRLLEKDAVILDRDFGGNVTVINNALRRDELPPRIFDAQNREAWKAYLDAARSFCEEKWPERSGKGKPSKKHSRPKTATANVSSASASTTDASQPAAVGSG